MKCTATAFAAITAATLALTGCPRTKPAAVEPVAAEVPQDVVAAANATIEQWRQAYEVRSFAALAQLYPHDLDVVVVHEGTALIGWSAVEPMLKDRLASTSAIRVRLDDIRVVSLAPDVASAVATMSRELTTGAATVAERGTLTLTLRHVGGEWLIAVEHYSYKRGS